MKKIVLCISVTVFIFPVLIMAQRSSANKNKPLESKEFKSPFRYVIVAGVSELEKYVNRMPEESLSLEVLMEDKAFNEKNLKQFFGLLSERYNSGQGLYIEVYTTLDAIRTPEENEHIDLKGPIDNYFRYKNAFFIRDGDANEYFKYSIPNVIDNKLVVLKGCYKCK